MQERKREQGFTLIELLVAIVVVGILTAVAIVGIAGLTNKGSSSACTASQDAATAASTVFYANSNPSAYPTTFTDLTTAQAPNPAPDMVLQTGVAVDTADAHKLNGKGWVLTMTPGTATTPPGFSGC